MLSLSYSFRPDEVYSSRWKLVFNESTVLFQRKLTSTKNGDSFPCMDFISHVAHFSYEGVLGICSAMLHWTKRSMKMDRMMTMMIKCPEGNCKNIENNERCKQNVLTCSLQTQENCHLRYNLLHKMRVEKTVDYLIVFFYGMVKALNQFTYSVIMDVKVIATCNINYVIKLQKQVLNLPQIYTYVKDKGLITQIHYCHIKPALLSH